MTDTKYFAIVVSVNMLSTAKIFFTGRGRLLGIFLFFLLPVLALFHPVLFGGKIFSEEFTLYLNYPVYASLGKALAHDGFLPIWSNGYLTGFPVYLTQIGLFHPLNLIFLRLFAAINTYNFLVVLNMVLASLAMYWLLRILSLGKSASIAGGLVYIFSQTSLYFASINVFSNFYPLLPLFFIAVFKISQGRRLYSLFGIAALAIGLLGGFTEGVVYIVISGTAFAIFLDIVNWQSDRSLLKNSKTFLFAISITFISGLVASFWIAPVLQYSELTLRGGGVSLEEASIADNIKSGDWLRFIYPYFHVLYSQFIPWITTSTRIALLYIGTLPFFLVLASFFIRPMTRPQKFFLGLAIATFVYILKIPFLFSVVHSLPVLNMFRGVWKWHFIFSFALAVLAAYAIHNAENIRVRALKFIAYFAAVLSGIALFAGAASAIISYKFKEQILNFANAYFEKNLYSATTGRPLQHYYDLIRLVFDESVKLFSFGNYRFLATVIFLIAAAAVLLFFYKKRISAELFKKAALVSIALNFIFIWQGFFNYFPKSLVAEEPRTAEFIKEREAGSEPFRVFRFHAGLATYADMGLNELDREEIFKLDTATVFPPLNLLFGLESITANDNFMSLRHSRLLALTGSESAPANQKDRIIHLKKPLEERVKIFTSPENNARLSMMNVKYLLSVVELPLPWEKVFSSEATNAKLPVYVYENPKVLPRVYFANSIKFASSEEEAFQAVIKNRDFNSETIIECVSDCQKPGRPERTDVIEILSLKDGYLKAKTKSKNPRWLVYSDSNLPNWEAYIDGERTQISAANFIYKAVFVPQGEHEVEFRYPGILEQSQYALKRLF